MVLILTSQLKLAQTAGQLVEYAVGRLVASFGGSLLQLLSRGGEQGG